MSDITDTELAGTVAASFMTILAIVLGGWWLLLLIPAVTLFVIVTPHEDK